MTVLLSNEDTSGDIDDFDVPPGNTLCLAFTPRPRFELEDKLVAQVGRLEVIYYPCGIQSVVHSPVLE